MIRFVVNDPWAPETDLSANTSPKVGYLKIVKGCFNGSNETRIVYSRRCRLT